ncbi:hypothetical protein H8E50_04150, partial [bacterium]|nr:hypothetical protein [bacterium]
LTLADLTAKALEVLKVNDDENRTLAEKIHQFFIQRLSGIYASQGFSHDVVNAVLAADSLTLRTISERLQVLAKLKTDAAFPAMITAAKRVYNILAKLEHAEVSSSLFNDETEKVLFDVSTEINMKLKKSEYRALLDFEKPINALFEAVLVMDKEPSIRANRLALLSHVKDTFNRLADFSQIEEQ